MRHSKIRRAFRFLILALAVLFAGCLVQKDSGNIAKASYIETLPPGARDVEILGDGWCFFWLGNQRFLYFNSSNGYQITITEVSR